jgi:hypothetical protein
MQYFFSDLSETSPLRSSFISSLALAGSLARSQESFTPQLNTSYIFSSLFLPKAYNYFMASLEQIRPKIVEILTKNDVARAGVFGSYARGEENEDSDIDILIEFKGRKNLFDLVGLEQDMEKELNNKVDLLTYKSLSPYMRDDILKEEVQLI